jgi:hypothetical protein
MRRDPFLPVESPPKEKSQWQCSYVVSQAIGRFGSTLARQSTMIMWVDLYNKVGRFPQVFRKPLCPIPNVITCPSSLGVRESISVANPFDHLREKGAMMQKVNVGHRKTKDWQDGEKERVTLRSSFRTLYRNRVVRSAVVMSMERKKVIKKQRKSKDGKRNPL